MVTGIFELIIALKEHFLRIIRRKINKIRPFNKNCWKMDREKLNLLRSFSMP
jgi:hypothetical protein